LHNLSSETFGWLNSFRKIRCGTAYQQALQISIEFGDRYSQVRTYHNLGAVAQALREFEQARNDYQQALQICIEFGDRVVEVITEATDIRLLGREATPNYLERLLE
jgi:Tfp pilus assembly protein PilF